MAETAKKVTPAKIAEQEQPKLPEYRKFGDYPVKESKRLSLSLAEDFETLWNDPETADYLKIAFGDPTGQKAYERGMAIRELYSIMIDKHTDATSRIISILASFPKEDVGNCKRSDVRNYLLQMFNDEELVGFFMPSAMWGAGILSAISQK